MPERFINPVPQYADSGNDLIPSGILVFLETGTTAAKNVFADPSLKISLGNEVSLDGAGRVPNIWLNGSYKVRLHEFSGDAMDPLGSQLWERDPVGGNVTGAGQDWAAGNIYGLDDIVKGSDGKYYISIIANNLGSDPTSTPAAWSELQWFQLWNTNATYAIDDLVKGSDEGIYASVVGSNKGNDPSIDDGTNWKNTADAAIGKTIQAWSALLDQVSANGVAENLIPFGDAALNPHQEGTSFTGLTDGQYVADLIGWKQAGTMVVDYAQSTGSETNSKSFKYTVTTGDASLAAADFAYAVIPLEGKNVAHLNYGGSDASSTTYAGRVKAKKTGTFCMTVQNSAGNRAYIGEITIDAADAWRDIPPFTVPGSTDGTWLTDIGIGLKLIICLAAGTGHHGAADTWLTTGDFATSNQANFVSTSADYFEFELIRGYEGLVDLGANYPGIQQVTSGNKRHVRVLDDPSTLTHFGNGFAVSSTIAQIEIQLSDGMRSIPDIIVNNVGNFRLSDTTTTHSVTAMILNITFQSENSILINVSVSGGLTTFRPYRLEGDGVVDDSSLVIDARWVL